MASFITSQKEKLAKARASRNRISHILNDLIGTEHPDDLMMSIIESLTEGSKTPSEGKYYVFLYKAKTPNIRYDQHPMVAVTDVFEWGFRGINFHWGQSRSYTFQEVASQLYQVTNEELQDLNTIPFAKFRINN